MPEWEDQGLYFSLILNAIAFAVFTIVAMAMHKAPKLARVLRPNLGPLSTGPKLLDSAKAFFRLGVDDDVLQSHGADAALHLLLLKAAGWIFMLGLVSNVILVPICATDSYLNTATRVSDPKGCKSLSVKACRDGAPFCELVSGTSSIPSNDTATGYCSTADRRGLFDLSAANITPTPQSWRLWVMGVCVVLFTASFSFVMIKAVAAAKITMLRTLRVILRSAGRRSPPSTSPSHKGADAAAPNGAIVTDEERSAEDAAAALLASRLAAAHTPTTVGSRTALLQGLSKESSHLVAAASGSTEGLYDCIFGTSDANPIFSFRAELDPDERMCVYRAPPKKLLALLEDEAAAKAALRSTVADEQHMDEDDEPPLMARRPPLCCKKVAAVDACKKDLEELQEAIKEILPERAEQEVIGVAVLTFIDPVSTLRFCHEYNACFGTALPLPGAKKLLPEFVPHEDLKGSVASIMGDKTGIIWGNIAASGPVIVLRTMVMIAVFIAFVFFWGVPVGFLGSLDSLATLPGIGPTFALFTKSVPVVIRGILQSYLPVIVLAIFNIVLPALMRIFAFLAGARTKGAEDSSVVLLNFVFRVMSGIVIQAALQGGLAQLGALIANPTQESAFALVVAIVSPQGGYWFAFIATAGFLGAYLNLLELLPVLFAVLFGGKTHSQPAFNDLFAPRPVDVPMVVAGQLFFFAIGMLFYATLPFLGVFAWFYFVNTYVASRALTVQSQKAAAAKMDFAMTGTIVKLVLGLHLFATVGAVLVMAMKLHWGGFSFCLVAVTMGVGVNVWARLQLSPVIQLSLDDAAKLCGHRAAVHEPTMDSSQTSGQGGDDLVCGEPLEAIAPVATDMNDGRFVRAAIGPSIAELSAAAEADSLKPVTASTAAPPITTTKSTAVAADASEDLPRPIIPPPYYRPPYEAYELDQAFAARAVAEKHTDINRDWTFTDPATGEVSFLAWPKEDDGEAAAQSSPA